MVVVTQPINGKIALAEFFQTFPPKRPKLLNGILDT